MNFQLEIDLVDAFRNHLDLFLPDGASVGLCKTEKRIRGNRFTDLTLRDFDGVISLSDRKNLRKITSWLQRQLARTTHKPMDAEKLCEGFVPKTKARRLKQIQSLIRWGFMTEVDGKVQTTQVIQELSPSHTVAFEAKVKDWKKAVIQARNYRRFANESWVIMPPSFATHDELITHCANAKVGLAVIGSAGVEKVLHAVVASDTIARRTFRINMLVDYTRHAESDRWFFIE